MIRPTVSAKAGLSCVLLTFNLHSLFSLSVSLSLYVCHWVNIFIFYIATKFLIFVFLGERISLLCWAASGLLKVINLSGWVIRSVGEGFYILNTKKAKDKLLLLTGGRRESTDTFSEALSESWPLTLREFKCQYFITALSRFFKCNLFCLWLYICFHRLFFPNLEERSIFNDELHNLVWIGNNS